ncbi:AAA family ATPase [Pseudomonas sp. SK3(2021)]|uniref:ATP-dependent nuclease n=1 Tax=Pseudomonas sp. SK3(2021) TaxID=2841064 RepID=UPI00192AF856|nr:AAA family ATPase [Pseudomonas sp. SK3(2021)]QQZ43350.1 AAA family ATPase [Pseudomonas sp. SK3(2021)]
MKYRESQLDKSLRQWFSNDNTKGLLRHIRIVSGTMRGLTPFHVSLEYPITAFAGINGSGKSTILALACCAYHNTPKAFKLPKRKISYYTFSDFFIQHTEEVPPQGVEISYGIAHDNWRSLPPGIGYQSRKKKHGGKWNDYDIRVKKTVVFLGIERIVPHSERSQSRSYSRSFKDVKVKGWEGKVKDAVGYVLSKKYDDYRHLEHTKYSLPIVKSGGVTYSGFNMGAGENALFEIFSIIYSCGQNSLLVLDEIELGLHAKAQRLFMEKLKEVCMQTHTQVICTTHSKEIFQCLPDDARFFIETSGGKTKVTAGISSDFAFSKLGALNQKELDIFVEDQVAKVLIESSLSAAIRSRVTIRVIGSATAISKQLAALYTRGEDRQTLAIFDGDQKALESDNLNLAKKMSERSGDAFNKWFKEKVFYLPGGTWPEAWIVQKSKEAPEAVAIALGVDLDQCPEVLEYALQAGKHNEFFEISQHVGLDKDRCLSLLCGVVCQSFPKEFDKLRQAVLSKLD